VLSGSTAGYFQGVSSGSTVITKTLDGSIASYLTGLHAAGTLLKSGVSFAATDFSNLQSGDSFALDITYYNARTKIGTSSTTALFDLFLDLSGPALAPFKLTTIAFGIDATVNQGSGGVPDVFTASFTQPAKVKVGDQWLKFVISDLPDFKQVAEDTFAQVANIKVTYFSPVPEPATYGLIASLGLLGVAACRRFRGAQGGSRQASGFAA